ncbi:MAG: alkaline phosphatase family protein [Planctomycetes bacterium]|nr:alkaline phosphatase family protein [Planctomycetota bacterium]
MHATAVILIAGLNESLLDSAPNLQAFRGRGTLHRLQPVLPAVTCTVQSTMLTGLPPSQHGIVGNGWFNRELNEVQFWKQSNALVHGEKVWEAARARDAKVTCAQIFWWYNMYSGADYSVTPRPIYKADGRKLPDVYSKPADLRDRLQRQLGQFPLFQFWGPGSSIVSSRWIARAARLVHGWHRPTLSLVYLPHLDYPLQKLGPDHPEIPSAVAEIDAVAGELIEYYENQGVRVVIVSEYGIQAVRDAVPINRVLRRAGLLRVREEEGLELLDAGACDAFAVADHQVAHVYIKDLSRREEVAALCRETPGVECVLDQTGKQSAGLDHPRAGELVLLSDPDRWFSYAYWLDDARAPDFARTVDIHRKPGYDPLELFIDPRIRFPKLTIARKLLRKRLGFRTLMDVIPLDASMVRGSHGRVDLPNELQPIMMTAMDIGDPPQPIPCANVKDILLRHLIND